jgi:DNA polymerase I-like protein with 3'-5' exonuclease and polymerase domains
MKVHFARKHYAFRPWRQADGKVFESTFSFDCETTLIDEERPWLTPAYVLGAAFDGGRGLFVPRDRVEAFFAAHSGVPVAFHNASFDLAVLHQVSPKLDLYARIDDDLVWDTQLLHRLFLLGTHGHTAKGKGQSTLERCSEEYLGVGLPKDVVGDDGRPVRLSYGRWLNQPLTDITPVYLEYLALDAVATLLVFQALQAKLANLLEDSADTWGYASADWLAEQVRRWGPQTHHIQLRASIVLRAITANGLHLDTARRADLTAHLESVLAAKRRALRGHGYLPGQKGSGKALQGILWRLERQHPEVDFPRTPTGLFATSHDALQDLAGLVPFVKLLFEYRAAEKLLSSFVGKMARPVLHPSFNVLAVTGRTTSFGDINAQNVPADDRVRSCLVPAPGSVFIDADYQTVELAALAEACVGQFNMESEMARAINAGEDLHRLVAAKVTGKAEADVTKQERQNAKPINFGKPGGMGNATLQAYAKTSFGVRLADEEVEALADAWFDLFPEMRTFLADAGDAGREVAELFGLTPAAHYEHTGDRRFLGHPGNIRSKERPNKYLGWMCLKTLAFPEPSTQAGKPYPAGDMDFFWHRVGERLDLLPANLHAAVRDRQPSPRLRRAVGALVGRAAVFTFTGRLRANASYSARHNTVFQGLAADGAKLALWRLWRAGYRIANFIHDQVLVEVPRDSDLTRHAKRVRRLMIQGMRDVVPDVRVDVSYAATERWYKGAEPVFGPGGRLQLWHPPPAKEKRRATPA